MKTPTHGRRGQGTPTRHSDARPGPRDAHREPARDHNPRAKPGGKPNVPHGKRPETRPSGGPHPASPAAPVRADGKPRLSLPQAASPQPAASRPPNAPRPPGRDRVPAAARQADTPRGAVWLYGLHAVAAALANPHRRLRRLLLTEEAQATLAARLAPPWPVAPEPTERARLDTLLGRDAVHQGIALLADPLAPPALAQVLEHPGPLLVLDQVNDPRNIGAILRSAAAFGAAAVITQDRNAPEETGALAKAASGALETVPLLRAVNIARTLIALKAAGCWTIGLDAEGQPLSGPTLTQRRVALVLGSEGEGLRRLTRETCDELAGIAMPGRHAALDSLNVSAAAAVALYELGRSS